MRQQRLLHPIFAIDEPTHRPPPKPSSSGILKQIRSERNPIAPKSQAVFTQAGTEAAVEPGSALVVHPASRMRLLWVWSVTRGAGPGWGGCDDPSGARVERGGSAQAGADDALTKTRRGAGPACADYPARG